ncbi:GM11484 [Drosophila sechellia]|uniref:ornithine decarboxylase n=1 Tax=Drosophila sechellia TaxID=7238 RepID=B4IPB0_DROSE|nr:GM11484 [Drosophila sechellia]
MVNGDLRIQYYEEELNIRKVIEQADLENLDQALNICDLSSLERKLRLWHKLMPRIEPHYAVKCNDDPVVVKFLADLGTGFDCASKNELKLVSTDVLSKYWAWSIQATKFDIDLE